MSLDIMHKVVCEKEATAELMARHNVADIENISEYPNIFHEKFADDIFYRKVEYVDWDSTFRENFGQSEEEFRKENLCFLIDSDGTHYFAPVNCDNPLTSNAQISLSRDKFAHQYRFDPHIFSTNIGAFSGGINTEQQKWKSQFKRFDIVLDFSRARKINEFIRSANAKVAFFESVLDIWDTERSYLIITY